MRFEQILGQAEAKHSVQEALQHGRLPHALLLTGPDGIGKLAFATAIAQRVNCAAPTPDGDACGKCLHCQKIQKVVHPDVHFVLPIISKTEGGKQLLTEDFFGPFREQFSQDGYTSFEAWQKMLDGDSKQLMIGVNEIRELKRKANLKAFEAPHKVFILWNVDRMNVQAANAFLKLLEEPPEKTIFILTSSDASRLLTTIRSRCQRIGLGRVPAEEIAQYLMRTRNLPHSYAHEISLVSEGSVSAAISFSDESSGEVFSRFTEWLRAVYSGNYAKITDQVEHIESQSKEFIRLFLAFSVKKLRDSLLFSLGMDQIALSTQQEAEFHRNFSKVLTPAKVGRMVAEIDKTSRHIAGNANPQMALSALSLRMHGIIRS